MYCVTLAQLAEITGGTLHADVAPEQTVCLGSISTDSRTLQPGEFFWGLEGPHHHGSDYAHEAFAKGAAGVVVNREVEPPADRWAVFVDDPLEALWQLAAWVRQQFPGQVVAVTGSVGKTMTRSMIQAVLSQRYRGTASPKNYNNHVGVPLSLLALDADFDFAVIEIGSNQPGEVAELAELVQPTVGVLTPLADAHLGHFGTREAIAAEKTALLDALPREGWAIVPGDDAHVRRLVGEQNLRVVTYGRKGDCDVFPARAASDAGRLIFDVEETRYVVPVWGRHHLTSALAAVAAGQVFGLPQAEIADGLAQVEAPPMRCEVLQRGGITVINDAYNASPTAMRAALELLRDINSSGRKIVLCGDMGDLGEHAPAAHELLGNWAVTVCGANYLLACGEHADCVLAGAHAAGMTVENTFSGNDVLDAEGKLADWLRPGDVVLLKGARRMRMERILDRLEAPVRQIA